ncbi:hypothetical protein [Pseudacidovorax intermedius]|uniref:HK97 gp10 family phage protein n=1 Tax=Pseudacidovorax intermedius TaxID=433924 RepID=A0A147GW26_9BURK|nr:hypothetical protein [Pseudacidovorax intermedius]KTT21897.1 hypothetical protein NS331_11085 [Pseudacidovorax intermedius]
MSSLHLSIGGLAAINRGLAEDPAMARRELLIAMTEATLLVEREAKERMPRGATGLTAQSIQSDAFSTPAGVLGVVSSSLPSASAVELGTRPHMPPMDALVPWVRAVLGVSPKRERSVAYLVARKIARRGTPAQQPFAKAIAATESRVLRMFEAAAGRIAARSAGGAS